MKIGLVDVDGHNFPNFALMKISAWHKMNGDTVEWYQPVLSHPEKVYGSKVFTFTPDYDYYPGDTEISRGGTGYDATVKLPRPACGKNYADVLRENSAIREKKRKRPERKSKYRDPVPAGTCGNAPMSRRKTARLSGISMRRE